MAAATQFDVICPYTPARLNRHTVAALEKYAPNARFVDVSGDPKDYYKLLAASWAEGKGFLVVEHDVEIHEDVIPQLEACTEPWCVFGYRAPDVITEALLSRTARPDPETIVRLLGRQFNVGWRYATLGCARFSGELLRELPGVPAFVHRYFRDWNTPLCGGFHASLNYRYVYSHHHWPAVGHHHPDFIVLKWLRQVGVDPESLGLDSA
jgi:hypothetical protein